MEVSGKRLVMHPHGGATRPAGPETVGGYAALIRSTATGNPFRNAIPESGSIAR